MKISKILGVTFLKNGLRNVNWDDPGLIVIFFYFRYIFHALIRLEFEKVNQSSREMFKIFVNQLIKKRVVEISAYLSEKSSFVEKQILIRKILLHSM